MPEDQPISWHEAWWLAPLFAPASLLYRGGLWARQWGYAAGLFEARSADRPVISVGNLTVGGNGKTPLVIHLVRRLSAMGLRVGVVSRGYGRKGAKRSPLVVSEGQGPLVSSTEGGDEPVMIAQKSSARVVVSSDRCQASWVAVHELDADVLILDDGFQHRRLKRDLNIVLLDAKRPFGSQKLLPRGNLRELPSALGRADLLAFNHGLWLGSHDAEPQPPAFVHSAADIPKIDIGVRPRRFVSLFDGHSEPLSWIEGRRVALLSGIARPFRFRQTMEALGAEVVLHHRHRDHARFTDRDLMRFCMVAKDRGAERFVTTEKDAVRLPKGAPSTLAALVIELEVFRGQATLLGALDEVTGG